MKKGGKVFIDGKPYTVIWSSDDMTQEERKAAADQALELLEWAGIPPVSKELLAAKARKRPNTITGG